MSNHIYHFCFNPVAFGFRTLDLDSPGAKGKAICCTLPYPTHAHTSLSCAMGSGLEWGRLWGGAVRRALQCLATDLRAALGSLQTDQTLSARLNAEV